MYTILQVITINIKTYFITKLGASNSKQIWNSKWGSFWIYSFLQLFLQIVYSTLGKK